jgi:hypothetical protein
MKKRRWVPLQFRRKQQQTISESEEQFFRAAVERRPGQAACRIVSELMASGAIPRGRKGLVEKLVARLVRESKP